MRKYASEVSTTGADHVMDAVNTEQSSAINVQEQLEEQAPNLPFSHLPVCHAHVHYEVLVCHAHGLWKAPGLHNQ